MSGTLIKSSLPERDFSCESGYLAMRQILAAKGRPTALFAGNERSLSEQWLRCDKQDFPYQNIFLL